MGFSPTQNQSAINVLNPTDPRDGVLIGIPTFGMINWKVFMSQLMMSTPIHTTIGYAFVVGQLVAEARNQIAEMAIRDGYKYVFFRDDDVAIPRESLGVLYALKTDIAAAVYYSKSYPPEPLIFKDGYMAGYQEWKFSDVLTDVDSCGMGCTLIDTGVFRRLKESNPDLPFFKTEDTSLGLRQGVPGVMTEDIYFLTRCKKELGVRPVIHTGIQCAHIDVKTGTEFMYDPAVDCPVWVQGNIIRAVPPAGHKWYERPKHEDAEKYKDAPIRLDLGCGFNKKPGFIGVDSNPETHQDVLEDVSNLDWVEPRFQRKADEIYASHILEHIPHMKTVGTLRSWARALKPGGTMEIRVPDFWWFVEALREDETKTTNWWGIYGAHMYPGDEHHTGFSDTRLRNLIRMIPSLKLISLEHGDIAVGKEWVLKAEKRSHEELATLGPEQEVEEVKELESVG